MDRWACVNVAALPLQALLVRRPDWVRLPAAVVSRDAPTGEVTWANGPARKLGVRPGLRYAAALGLAPTLRAGVIEETDLREATGTIAGCLGSLTPDVEPSHEMHGVFWLNAAGMGNLFQSEASWAMSVKRRVRKAGYRASVVVGATKWGTYAVARSTGGITVLPGPEEEREAVRRVPLSLLDLPADVRETLDLLGIATLGAFLDLPAPGVLRRFGKEAHAFHCRLTGLLWEPLRPERAEPPPEARIILDYPEKDLERLVALVERHLAPLLATLERRGEALEELRIALFLDGGDRPLHVLRPSSPTLHLRHLIELVRLRFETQPLAGGVEEVRIAVVGAAADGDQIGLLGGETRRDLSAGGRALARIRARFGEKAAVRAVLEESHLPEEMFRWEEVEAVAVPHPSPEGRATMVRRVFTEPAPLPEQVRARLVKSRGSYVLSGWWWNTPLPEEEPGDEAGRSTPITRARDYSFAELDDGRLLWVYYDRERAAWFVQGEVR